MHYKKFIFVLCCGLAVSLTNAQQMKTFSYTGSMQTWTVPACVVSITIDCFGAQGVGKSQENYPGYGGEARGVLNVLPGQVYNIYVGGQSNWNGGGVGQNGANGGDASDVRYGGVALANRVIVAGGGGGSGGDNWQCTGGVYANGGGGTPVGNNFVGGGGGEGYTSGSGCGTNGATSGGTGGTGYHGGGGGGGGLNSGGAGAITTGCGGTATTGTIGQGGASFNASGCNGEATGAGGGGYYGGGGAAGCNCGAGQGGGGSSWTGSLTSPFFKYGVWTGNGQVIITYSGTVSITPNIIKNVSCNGGSNGKASAILNGIPPYTYSWAPAGGTGDTASGLTAGVYTVTVTESCGSSASAVITITQPASALSVSAGTLTNVMCYGGNSGSASSFTSGGTTPYTYLWAPSGGTARNATGLTAGTYSLNITDNHGCTASASTSITQPNALSVSANITADVQCNGGANGSIASSVTYGTTPYTYFWSNGGTLDTATLLTAGTYSLRVTDNNGCTGSASVTITQPSVFSASASVVSNVTCYGGNNGNASSSVNGGAPPYSYFWSDGGTNATEIGLSAGTYTVSATDYCGGSVTAWVTITQPIAVSGSATVIESINCNGASNGCASVSASGGTAPYGYQWSDVNNQTTVSACGLSAGTYTVNIMDYDGCTGFATATITQPSAISISTNSTMDNGNCNGSASVTASGGVAPYTYAWANGGTANNISSQCGGIVYCCTVTDAMGCQENACVTIKKSTTGIANLNGGTEGITIYPNPNNGQFTIQAPVSSGQSTVVIYNVLGEKVCSQFSTFDTPLSINLSSQPNGIYLYRIMSESGSLLGEGKIMLQK